MEPPIGFITLRDAADAVGRKVAGKNWQPLSAVGLDTIICKLDAEIDQVIKLVAEQCEAGSISAAYRSIIGADDLDRAVWQMPHWRNFFATGTIDLDLPLLDDKSRPNKDGHTTRCTREVFVRKDELERFVAALPRPNARPSAAAQASQRQIGTIVTDYRGSLAANAAPSIAGLQQFARAAGLIGHRNDLRAEYHRQFPNQRVGRPAQ